MYLIPVECMEFTGYRNTKGYGTKWSDGKNRLAHRLAYESTVGPIPEGLVIDHLCRNRACVNPAHMEPVTQAENVRRGQVAARWRERTHCANGHEFNDENTYYRPDGHRRCRLCVRDYMVGYRAKKVAA